jgi:hypothetical protein
MAKTYCIVRFFQEHDKEIIETGVSLEDALEHCLNPETSSQTCTTAEGQQLTDQRGPWFDGYEEE